MAKSRTTPVSSSSRSTVTSHFLREVLCSDVSMNVEIPTSKLEKQARIEEAQLPHSETVAALRTGAK